MLLGVLDSERFADIAPATMFATLLDEGRYYGSISVTSALGMTVKQLEQRLRRRLQRLEKHQPLQHEFAVRPQSPQRHQRLLELLATAVRMVDEPLVGHGLRGDPVQENGPPGIGVAIQDRCVNAC